MSRPTTYDDHIPAKTKRARKSRVELDKKVKYRHAVHTDLMIHALFLLIFVPICFANDTYAFGALFIFALLWHLPFTHRLKKRSRLKSTTESIVRVSFWALFLGTFLSFFGSFKTSLHVLDLKISVGMLILSALFISRLGLLLVHLHHLYSRVEPKTDLHHKLFLMKDYKWLISIDIILQSLFTIVLLSLLPGGNHNAYWIAMVIVGIQIIMSLFTSLLSSHVFFCLSGVRLAHWIAIGLGAVLILPSIAESSNLFQFLTQDRVQVILMVLSLTYLVVLISEAVTIRRQQNAARTLI